MPKEKSAGAVIFRMENSEPYYLLLRYYSGHWEFVKGHIEEGESNEETVIREIEEETGIKEVEIILGFKEHVKYFFKASYDLEGEEKKKAPWIFKLVVFYLAQTKEIEIKISKEHKDFIWLPYKEAFLKLTYKNAKEILRKANDYLINR